MVIGSANLNLFATKTINPPINNTKLALVTNIPPIEAIFACFPLSLYTSHFSKVWEV